MGACVSSRGFPRGRTGPRRERGVAARARGRGRGGRKGARRAASETTTAAASTLTRAPPRAGAGSATDRKRRRRGGGGGGGRAGERPERCRLRALRALRGLGRARARPRLPAGPPTLRARSPALHSPTHPLLLLLDTRPAPGTAGTPPRPRPRRGARSARRRALEEDAVARLEEEEEPPRETPALPRRPRLPSSTTTSTSTHLFPPSLPPRRRSPRSPPRRARSRGHALLRAPAACEPPAGRVGLTALRGPREMARASLVLVHARGVSAPASPGLGARDERSGRRVRLPRASRPRTSGTRSAPTREKRRRRG